MHNRHHIPPPILPTLFYHSHQIHSRRTSHEQSFILNQVVRHVQCLLVTHLLSIVNLGCVEVSSGTVQSDTFDYSIERIFKSIAFLFLRSEEHIVLDFIKQS